MHIMENERIVTAACKDPVTGEIATGGMHADAWARLYGDRVHFSLCPADGEGFLTSSGRFVDRRAAFQLAKHAGQIAGLFDGHLCSEDF